MCQCDPRIRTPFCGKGDCQWPEAKQENCREIENCLVCGYADLIDICNLGLQPLANNLKKNRDDADLKFPIVLNVCPMCTHKQLSVAVDHNILFSDYLYKTGTSKSHLDFFYSFVSSLGRWQDGNRVLDIGCNDGSLLRYFKEKRWQCLGIEPSFNLARETMERGIPVINDFFPTKHAFQEKFHCITAFNVFAHNAQPLRFLTEMTNLLEKDGRIYIITTRANLIDNLYHEHISFFSPQSMLLLAKKAGLDMVSFKEVSMHGNAYLFELCHTKENAIEKPEAFTIKSPCVGYGSSAGATVLMNHYGWAPEYVVDDNQLKQWRFIPGVNVPVVHRTKLVEDSRDLNIIIFAHHLFDEIKVKIKSMRPNNNDTFIHPFKGEL